MYLVIIGIVCVCFFFFHFSPGIMNLLSHFKKGDNKNITFMNLMVFITSSSFS